MKGPPSLYPTKRFLRHLVGWAASEFGSTSSLRCTIRRPNLEALFALLFEF